MLVLRKIKHVNTLWTLCGVFWIFSRVYV